MLRFPNPGSDVESYIRIYKEIFRALNQQATFSLDDMSKTLVESRLVTSCGYMGEEALARSMREDRSRDPIYNQSKMYSEIYKILGWLHPSPQKALDFKFTYLGAHVVEAIRDPAAIFQESILGIIYPNSILDVKGNHRLRPFAAIMKTIDRLGGNMCRDEMIIGPLSLENDRDEFLFNGMIAEIHTIRGDFKKLTAKLKNLSGIRKIAINTMHNYTRFPIGVLKWLGWVTTEWINNIYGKAIVFLSLTKKGRSIIEIINTHRDIREADLKSVDSNIRNAVVRIAFYQMLERAGFELDDTLRKLLSNDLKNAEAFLGKAPLIISSPFQELSPAYLTKIFPDISGSGKSYSLTAETPKKSNLAGQTISKVSLFKIDKKIVPDSPIAKLFKDEFQKNKNISKVVNTIFDSAKNSNKESFYPFVSQLFRAIGYNCDHSRPGVNYQRWDAFIVDEKESIPIEIKSPGEEEYISVKAVRQAVENKIILLSRKAYPTLQKTTSLVVGYNLPNDRSEVMSLINDIYTAFNIIIGVVGLKSLLLIAAETLLNNKEHKTEALKRLLGFVDVSNT
jgi:hypothetical protein